MLLVDLEWYSTICVDISKSTYAFVATEQMSSLMSTFFTTSIIFSTLKIVYRTVMCENKPVE